MKKLGDMEKLVDIYVLNWIEHWYVNLQCEYF